MNKKFVVAISLIALGFLAAIVVWLRSADGGDSGPLSDKIKQVVQKEQTFTYPFTGMETEEEPNNRAIAVMVNNQSQARPQSGLHEADIVFELLAEGNITRFLALYHSQIPERVGPVRSAREYYVDLADRYGALYVYHGAAKFVDRLIEEKGIDYLNGAKYDNDGELFIRESFRKAPHNSYLLTDALYQRAAAKQYAVTGKYSPLPFLKEGESVSGQEAAAVRVTYFSDSLVVDYQYDQDSQSYHRISDGVPSVDLETNTPIMLDNVFIIEAKHEVIDQEGRRAIDLDSGGKGYLLQRGKVQVVEWINDRGYLLATKDKEVLPFVPGKTWINVIPSNPSTNVDQVQITEYNE